jgi:hypothetical protein
VPVGHIRHRKQGKNVADIKVICPRHHGDVAQLEDWVWAVAKGIIAPIHSLLTLVPADLDNQPPATQGGTRQISSGTKVTSQQL